MQKRQKIVVIGTGYVGLVTGACLAAWGHDVVCADKDKAKIALLKRGGIPIYEPGLDRLVASGMAKGNLDFAAAPLTPLREASVVFIAVGTPPLADGDVDLGHVRDAADEIAVAVKSGTAIVLKSTVPVGTGDEIEAIVANRRGDRDVAVVSNPEFLREGSAIEDFMNPDRVVIGSENDSARRLMLSVYQPLIDRSVPVFLTERRTSELIKYASNAFLAVKISYINEMADLCEKVGASVSDLAIGMGLDRRVGASFLNAGPGYGGSCFPKDTLGLLRAGQRHGVNLGIVRQSVLSNNERKRAMVRKIAGALGGRIAGRRIAVLGLSFKPETDDVRESPALALISGMQGLGASIAAYDPAAMPQASAQLRGVAMCDGPYECAAGADAVVIVTDWKQFRSMDLVRLRKCMAGDVLVDLRNIVNVAAARHSGFRVTNVGHPEVAGDSADDSLRRRIGQNGGHEREQTLQEARVDEGWPTVK